MLRLSLLSFFVLFLAACSPGGSPDLASLPDGWTREGNRFWKTGTDTTGLFPDLETAEAMGVIAEAKESDRRAYVERNLKRRLVVLYRHNPRAVDSLFAARFPTWIRDQNLGGSLQAVVNQMERPATQALGGAFRQPRPRLTLGEEIPYAFPDSLRQRVRGARVRMQIALDADGAPLAIELLEPANATLDLIAVRAASQQRWSPIYLASGNAWKQIPGWVRYNVLFGQPDSEPEGETSGESS